MHRRLRPLAGPVLVVVLLLGLAGCGSSDNTTETGGGGTATVGPSVTGSPPVTGTLEPDQPIESPPVAPGNPDQPDGGATEVAPRGDAVDPSPTTVESAEVSDSGMTLFYWGGVEACYVLDRVEVDEAPDTVTVTLYTGTNPDNPGAACVAMAQYFSTTIELRAPLGSRALVDGATGEPVAVTS